MTAGPENSQALGDRAAALAGTLRQLGWINGSLYALHRVLSIVSGERARLYKYYLVAQPVAAERRLPARRGAGVEIRRLEAGDPLLRDLPRPERVFPYRFDQSAICLAGLMAGKCIAFIWLILGPYQEDEVRCRFLPSPEGQSAWDFDVYVAPEHRNGIAFLKLWDEANALLSSRGYRWSLSRISAFNSGSRYSHARMGAQNIGSITFLSIGPWQLSVATVPPYFHFSTNAKSFPTFRWGPRR